MFEKEIEYFLKKQEEYYTLSRAMDKADQDHKAVFEMINKMQMEKIIATKANEMWAVISKAYDTIVLREEQLGVNSTDTIKELFSKAFPSYDEKSFIEELQKSYITFCKNASELKSISLKDNKSKYLLLAGAYANIKDIKSRASHLCHAYLMESNMKLKLFEDFMHYGDKKQLALRENRTQIFQKIKTELLEFENKLYSALENGKKAVFFEDEPSMPSEFSANNLLLGVGLDKNFTTLDLPAFSKSYKIPKSADTTVSQLTLGSCDNIVITYDKDKGEDTTLWNIIKCISVRFLLSYPSKYKKIAALHNKSAGSGFLEIMSIVRHCCAEGEFLFSDNINKGFDSTYNEMEHTLDKLSNIIDERRRFIYDSGHSSIIEYNVSNSDNAQPLMLVFAKDLDFSRYDIKEKVMNIALSGPRVGIHLVLMTNNESYAKLESEARVKEVLREFKYEDGYLEEKNKNNQIDCCSKMEILTSEYFEKIKDLSSQYVSSIDFLEFQKEFKRHSKEDYRKVIEFSIGKNGANPVYVSLDSTSPLANAMVEGMIGTGKTALVQTYILSAAYNYKPEELEIWLFDFMKGGPDFKVFEKLKHVRYMALGSNKIDALELLKYINGELEKRGPILGSSNPRVLIVIDEYSVINQQCVKELTEMSRQIRKYGATLLLSSQDAPFDEITKNFAHRFEMYEASKYSLISELTKDNETEYGLAPKSRLAVYKGKDEKLVSLRYAYAGNYAKMAEIVDYINNMYSQSKPRGAVVVGQMKKPSFTDIRQRELNEIFYKNSEKQLEVKIDLGKKRLSPDSVVYKVNNKNRKLYLIGNKYRASCVEHLFVEAFTRIPSKEPIVYYLNLSKYDNDICIGIRDNDRVRSNNIPIEVDALLYELYDIYKERCDQITLFGKDIEHPIEVIIHCAGKASNLFDGIVRTKRGATSNTLIGNYDFSFADNMKDDDFERYLQGSGGTSDSISQESKQYPPLDEILRELLLNEDTEMNFVIHLEDISDIDKNKFLPSNISDFKDCIIIPSIPTDEDDVSYAEIVNVLRGIGQHDLADYYRERTESLETDVDKEKERANFQNLILIDDHNATSYLPYEK